MTDTPTTKKTRPLPSKETLHAIFRYKDGELYRRPRPVSDFPSKRIAGIWNTMYANKRAGGTRKNGYRDVCIDGVRFLEHRVIAAMFIADPADHEVDHRDGNKGNNRVENLRLCSHKQNAVNRPGKKNGLPKHVTFHPLERKYKVTLRADGRRHHIGTFATVSQAEKAAIEARKRLHGEFSNERPAP